MAHQMLKELCDLTGSGRDTPMPDGENLSRRGGVVVVSFETYTNTCRHGNDGFS